MVLIIYSPFPTQNAAESAAKRLLDEKLIACANIIQSRSIYMWKDKLEGQAEYILIAKTSVRKRRSAASRIRELHPHETPAILFWSAGANREYSEWVSGQVL